MGAGIQLLLDTNVWNNLFAFNECEQQHGEGNHEAIAHDFCTRFSHSIRRLNWFEKLKELVLVN
jgi:hypothetical protein